MTGSLHTMVIKTPFICEAVCAGLLNAGHTFDDIQTHYRGGFKKCYSNDIENIELAGEGAKTTFKIILNRDGIYDKLPEGLFHQTKGSGKVNTVQDAVDEHKQFKEEEKQARKFFAPIEQMLFRYRTETEIAERNALRDMQNGRLNTLFYDFWNIPHTLPKDAADRMLQLMPRINYIKGSPQTTATALSYILHKELTIEVEEHPLRGLLAQKTMQELRLGIDAVTGETNHEWAPVWKFTIENIADKQLAEFTETGPMGRLLQRFTDIFIPLETNALYELNPHHDMEQKTYENILGYGCRL